MFLVQTETLNAFGDISQMTTAVKIAKVVRMRERLPVGDSRQDNPEEKARDGTIARTTPNSLVS